MLGHAIVLEWQGLEVPSGMRTCFTSDQKELASHWLWFTAEAFPLVRSEKSTHQLEAVKLHTPWLTSWARPTFEQGCLSVCSTLRPLSGRLASGRAAFPSQHDSRRQNEAQFFTPSAKPKQVRKTPLDVSSSKGWEALPIANVSQSLYPCPVASSACLSASPWVKVIHPASCTPDSSRSDDPPGHT